MRIYLNFPIQGSLPKWLLWSIIFLSAKTTTGHAFWALPTTTDNRIIYAKCVCQCVCVRGRNFVCVWVPQILVAFWHWNWAKLFGPVFQFDIKPLPDPFRLTDDTLCKVPIAPFSQLPFIFFWSPFWAYFTPFCRHTSK